MAVTVTVLYPNTSGSKFDMSYYLSTHMPLVQKTWAPYGLVGWRVIKHNGTPGGDEDAPFQVEAKLEWKDQEGFGKAATEAAAEVFGDIENFTDVKPTLMVGEEMGVWGA